MKRYVLLVFLLTPYIISSISLHSADFNSPLLSTEFDYSFLDSHLLTEEFGLLSISEAKAESGHEVLLEFESELSLWSLNIAERNGLEFQRMNGRIVHVGRIYSARVTGIDSLLHLREMGLQRVQSGHKNFHPALMSSVPVTGAPDVWANLKVGGEIIDGSGVRVAVIDTGATWLHPTFWRVTSGPHSFLEQDGRYYIDLNNDSVVDPGEGPISIVHVQNPGTYEVSNEYIFIDIADNGVFNYGAGDRWLAGVDEDEDGVVDFDTEKGVLLGDPKVVALLDQESGNVYTRGVNLTTLGLSVGDSNGHGTHVASTIAGGQIGHTGTLGVAPNADLIIIRSTFSSSAIIEAIFFAIENGADIINMSFSSFIGFMDGTDLEDLAVNEAFLKHGVMCTLAAGNLGGQSKHAGFTATSGAVTSTTVSANNPSQYSFLNILWYSEDRDERLSLLSPEGQTINLGAFNQMSAPFEVDEDELTAYVFPDTSLRGTNQIVIQLYDSSHKWDSGSWSLRFENPSGDDVRVDVYAWDNTWAGSGLRVQSNVDNSRTISSPGTADLGITVASYQESISGISSSSGRGPRIDGLQKPDIAAPGVSIRAAQNSLNSLWTERSGTSMAAPHVAGLLALIRQSSGDSGGWLDRSALLVGGGGVDNHYSPADIRWGYGLVNAPFSIRHILDLHLEEKDSLDSWTGIDVIYDDGENFGISGELDILDVRIYHNDSVLAAALNFRETPSFNGTNTLTLEWDVDSSLSTGPDGIDLVVNITGGDSTVFEWTTSEFQISSLFSDYWIHDTTLFLVVEKPIAYAFGELTFHSSSLAESPVDSTEIIPVIDYWRPLISDIDLSLTSSSYNLSVFIRDRDTSPELISADWQIVRGILSEELGATVTGSLSFTVQGDLSDISTDELLSFMVSVSDSSTTLYSPPIPLSTVVGINVEIVKAELDSTQIVIGFLRDSLVTGEIQITGYMLVDRIRVAFHSSTGLWRNFSLSGSDGTYPITVSSAAFSGGEYNVYVVVSSIAQIIAEEHFAVLQVIQDDSLLFLTIGSIVAVIVIIMIVQRRGQSASDV